MTTDNTFNFWIDVCTFTHFFPTTFLETAVYIYILHFKIILFWGFSGMMEIQDGELYSRRFQNMSFFFLKINGPS